MASYLVVTVSSSLSVSILRIITVTSVVLNFFVLKRM